jgi:hypothetical protein
MLPMQTTRTEFKVFAFPNKRSWAAIEIQDVVSGVGLLVFRG